MKLSRRQVLEWPAALAPARLFGRRHAPFRLAICNETFSGWSFEAACRGAKKAGYTGLEIAPFTLSEDPAALPRSRRAELREMMKREGLDYVGLHSLLRAPQGLHVTTPDAATRRRSWDYVRRLIDLCADLGEGGILVFGSGKQRSTAGGSSVADAVERFRDGLAGMAPAAGARRVTILVEALAPHLSDVVTSLDQAVALVKQIDSPAVQTMFDTHNAVAETTPHRDLIRKHHRYISHVHINEMDGRHPGTGSYDFAPVLQALRDVSYEGWVSLEVFDFTAGGEKIAADSARWIRRIEARL